MGELGTNYITFKAFNYNHQYKLNLPVSNIKKLPQQKRY